MNDIDISYIASDIAEELKQKLDRCGFYYRIFSRQKSKQSIDRKLRLKGDEYRNSGKKMQDIIGIRIACYFREDINLIYHELLKLDTNIPENNSIDNFDDGTFRPQKLNMIFRMKESHSTQLLDQLRNSEYIDLIDATYEIQLRSILSEGWHEVEHDLRYKCKSEWHGLDEESRMLNGIYATLETSERAMGKLFQDVAYTHFKNSRWAAMFRNHFYIRVLEQEMNPQFTELFNENNDIPKQILRYSKQALVSLLFRMPLHLPLSIDNLIFIINRAYIKNERIMSLEQESIKPFLDPIDKMASVIQ